MKIEVIDSRSISLADDGTVTPIEQPAIFITMHVVEAAEETYEMTLCQTFPVPSSLVDEREAALWIHGRIAAVLLHELDEFFRFDDQVLKPPAHPIPD